MGWLLQLLSQKETAICLFGGVMYGFLSYEMSDIQLRQDEHSQLLKGVAHLLLKNGFAKAPEEAKVSEVSNIEAKQ